MARHVSRPNKTHPSRQKKKRVDALFNELVDDILATGGHGELRCFERLRKVRNKNEAVYQRVCGAMTITQHKNKLQKCSA
jgi:hypothetical protein